MNNGKATINNRSSSYEVIIPSKKNWIALIFGTIWMGEWYMGFHSVLNELWGESWAEPDYSMIACGEEVAGLFGE